MSASTPFAEGDRPLTVSQLTTQVRLHLEERFPAVHVEGEISNWTVAASGHAYFKLKDDNALLECVMWRSALARCPGTFRDGDQVAARGAIGVYDRRGQYQLTCQVLQPVGEGLLWQKFLALKRKLQGEGLFDPDRKRAIPAFPSAVGVVTSPTGAAVRDILSVLGRRAPQLPVYLYPARVQGKGAAAEVARGIRVLAASGLVDVLIVGRGGGSLEDLWEFNDEELAREIARCPIPVISAVGHEVDESISDYVADLRAPTPSAAAELVCEDIGAANARLVELIHRMDRAVRQQLDQSRTRLRLATQSHPLREPEMRLRESQQRLDEALRRLDESTHRRLERTGQRLERARGALLGHDPALILQKGYAIVRRARDGKVLTRSAGLRPGHQVLAEMSDGRFRAVVADDVPDLFE